MKILNASVLFFALAFSAGCSSTTDTKPAAGTPAQPPAGQVDNRGADNDFDRDAMGTWLTTGCYAAQNGGTGTMKIMLIIRGHGNVSSTYVNYTTPDCTGVAQASEAQNANYTINNYANGGGEVSIADQLYDITIKDNKMVVSDGHNPIEYARSN